MDDDILRGMMEGSDASSEEQYRDRNSDPGVDVQHHDDAEDHGRGADDGGADEHGLGRRLEGVARAVALLELVLRAFEVGAEAEVAFELSGDTRLLLDLRKFVDGLGVIGHRAEGVDRDGDGFCRPIARRWMPQIHCACQKRLA